VNALSPVEATTSASAALKKRRRSSKRVSFCATKAVKEYVVNTEPTHLSNTYEEEAHHSTLTTTPNAQQCNEEKKTENSRKRRPPTSRPETSEDVSPSKQAPLQVNIIEYPQKCQNICFLSHTFPWSKIWGATNVNGYHLKNARIFSISLRSLFLLVFCHEPSLLNFNFTILQKKTKIIDSMVFLDKHTC
jgi:hypothetical protein